MFTNSVTVLPVHLLSINLNWFDTKRCLFVSTSVVLCRSCICFIGQSAGKQKPLFPPTDSPALKGGRAAQRKSQWQCAFPRRKLITGRLITANRLFLEFSLEFQQPTGTHWVQLKLRFREFHSLRDSPSSPNLRRKVAVSKLFVASAATSSDWIPVFISFNRKLPVSSVHSLTLQNVDSKSLSPLETFQPSATTQL